MASETTADIVARMTSKSCSTAPLIPPRSCISGIDRPCTASASPFWSKIAAFTTEVPASIPRYAFPAMVTPPSPPSGRRCRVRHVHRAAASRAFLFSGVVHVDLVEDPSDGARVVREPTEEHPVHVLGDPGQQAGARAAAVDHLRVGEQLVTGDVRAQRTAHRIDVLRRGGLRSAD